MYGKPKTVETRAVFNSRKVKIVLKKVVTNSKTKGLKLFSP